MSEKKAINDSTIARIAGNILSGYVLAHRTDKDDSPAVHDAVLAVRQRAVHDAVEMARAVAAEVERTSQFGG